MTANKPTNKAELLRFQREGRERWEALLARVPAERIAEPGVKGDRSVKDIVAHLAAWERHATERLHTLARGAALEPPTAAGHHMGRV
ncbi:MAG: ClbS/DfsB family four-helix bundle protein [Candidatus Methylomirabilaceae bacterium]